MALASAQALPPSDCSLDAPHHLTCRLSSINSRLERTDFSVIPNTTTSLRVFCSQPDVGSLPPTAFASLTSLRHLALHGCALDLRPATLDLSASTVRSLPAGELCALHALTALNMSA